MTLSRTSKLFLQSIFGPAARHATVEWWKFDQQGRSVGRTAARAVTAAPAADDAVYWSVGMMRAGTGRANANVVSVHALVADDVGTKVDRDLVDMFMPVPTKVVETSEGNYQYVWAVPDGMTVAQHASLWAGMEVVLGRRMDGSDPGHLFRLPEGVNGKPGKLFSVRELAGVGGTEYKLDYLASLLPFVPFGTPHNSGAPGLQGSGSAASSSSRATVQQVEAALRVLPNDGTSDWCASRKAWVDMGMAIKGALGDDGLAVWVAWCAAQPQTEDPVDVWEGLNPHSIGWGHIEILAKQHGGVGLAADAFNDGDPGLEEAMAGHGKRTYDHFWAYLPKGCFIDTVTGSLWTDKAAVNNTLPGQTTVDAKGKVKVVPATDVLQRTKPVHQLSWLPGRGMIVDDVIVREGGVEACVGNRIYNLYKAPPRLVAGSAQMSLPWTSHVRKLYPEDAEHILNWFAHRIQHPGEKINHALVIGGGPGIGKDTMIEPLVTGVGTWNFGDVKPSQILDRFNTYKQSVVLRINEVYDLGEGLNRVKFYQAAKTIIAAPPQTLQVERKGLDIYSIPNVVGVLMTTNHKLDGLYLPADDRRHYVAWSKATEKDFKDGYFRDLYAWLDRDGRRHVIAFLQERDLSKFNPKEPPMKTRAFRSIVSVSKGASNDQITDVVEAMGSPDVFSWEELMNKASGDLHDLAKANPRALGEKLEQEGYEKIENPANRTGRWRVGSGWASVWGKRSMTVGDQQTAAQRWATNKAAEIKKSGA